MPYGYGPTGQAYRRHIRRGERIHGIEFDEEERRLLRLSYIPFGRSRFVVRSYFYKRGDIVRFRNSDDTYDSGVVLSTWSRYLVILRDIPSPGYSNRVFRLETQVELHPYLQFAKIYSRDPLKYKGIWFTPAIYDAGYRLLLEVSDVYFNGDSRSNVFNRNFFAVI